MKKFAILTLAIFALAGCQKSHEIEVSLRDGLPHFDFDPETSISEIEVTAVGRQPRSAWKLTMTGTNGPILRQITYGQVPRGLVQTARPEPFMPGQLYRVDLSASDGVGSQYFIVSDEAVPSDSLTVLPTR